MKKKYWILLAVAVMSIVVWQQYSNRSPAHFGQRKTVPPPLNESKSVARHKTVARISGQQSARVRAEAVSGSQLETKDLMAIILEDKTWSHGDFDRFLENNQYSAESLITAYATSRDTNYLHQAAVNYPEDPMVQFRVILSDLYPDEKQDWIEALKRSTPDNALANYLSAVQHREQGDFQTALQEVREGNEKSEFLDYHLESAQITEEFFQENGYTSQEAKAKALFSIEFPHLSPIRELSREMANEVTTLRQQGNDSEAELLAMTGISMAQQMILDDGNWSLVNQLVGLSIEESFLGSLDENSQYFGLPMTAGEMNGEIQAKKDELGFLSDKFNTLLQLGDEQLTDNYLDRIKLFGEYEALKWLDRQI